MRRVLATDFGIWPVFKDLARVSDSMISSHQQWASLANYVLLYDQLIIPTGNLQVLPVLRLMLGEGPFDELIRTKGIILTRFDQWFAYAGNGGGLSFFKISGNPDKPEREKNLGLAYFQPLDEAIDVALAATNPPSNSMRRTELKNLLIDNVVELPMQAIADSLKDETYKDILGSTYLRDMMLLRNAGRSLDRLVGIEANKLIIHDPHHLENPGENAEIRAVLRVAFENLVLSIGGHSEATEITGDDGTLTILRAKGQRFGLPIEGQRAFAEIQNISGVPDIGVAFAKKQITSSQLIDLRYSKHCQVFRNWLAAGTPFESTDETIRRYVESLGKPSWIENLPIKLLRFATTTGLGFLEPVSGTIGSGVDTFFLSKWFPGRSPRLFLKEAKVMLTKPTLYSKPSMHGRDRNRPCTCGSGKKFKRCCGQ